MTEQTASALPSVVDRQTWQAALDDLRVRWGRQEDWQDSPDGWPKSPTYSNWLDSPDVARLYGPTETPERGPLISTDASREVK